MHPTSKLFKDIILLWKTRTEELSPNVESSFYQTKREDCVKAISFISKSFMDEWLSPEEARGFVGEYW
jgi:hypothetical protein